MKQRQIRIVHIQYGTPAAPLVELLRLEHLNDASASIGTVTFAKGQRIPAGAGRSEHDRDEVSFIVDGEIDIQTDQRTATVGPGTLVHIPAGVAHSSVARQDTRIVFMLIG